MIKRYNTWQKHRDYGHVFSTPEGRRVLLDLCDAGHIFQPTYVPGDFGETAFREGERNIVLRLLTIMNLTDQQMIRLSQEEVDIE